jgi:hypothetical protein
MARNVLCKNSGLMKPLDYWQLLGSIALFLVIAGLRKFRANVFFMGNSTRSMPTNRSYCATKAILCGKVQFIRVSSLYK